jgi:hypothetical protein
MMTPVPETCINNTEHKILLQLRVIYDLPLQRFQFHVTVIKYFNEGYLIKHKLLIASPTLCVNIN